MLSGFLYVSFLLLLFFFLSQMRRLFEQISRATVDTQGAVISAVISVTRRSCAAPILKVDRHISDRFLPLF